jgi:TPR repeat protein
MEHAIRVRSKVQRTSTQTCLEDVVPLPSVERPRHHLVPQAQLELLDDPDSLCERSRRLRLGIYVCADEESGWNLNIQAARLGHPVALALCFLFGRGAKVNIAKAVELLRGSAERGHPAGMCSPNKRTERARRANSAWFLL